MAQGADWIDWAPRGRDAAALLVALALRGFGLDV
jgi:hypothetical protein